MSRELIDTGAIYAFVVRNDANHTAARSHAKAALKRGTSFVLIDVVFAETLTLMKSRLGADIAIRTGRELRDNPAFAWLALGADGERETWGLFQKYVDKEWSFTDCAILAVSQSLRVSSVFAFDRHFKQMPGISRVP